MKKKIFAGTAGAAAAAAVAASVVAALLLATLAFATIWFPATVTDRIDLYQGDLLIRYNEIKCLKQGVNPFNVWNGDVRHGNFAPFTARRTDPAHEYVHAHMPWEYTMLLPVTSVPLKTAKNLALALNSVLYLALVAWAVRFAMKHGKNFAAACLIAALAFGFNVWEWSGALFWANYGGVFCALTILMAYALAKDGGDPFSRHAFLTGLAIAAMMVKPHFGFLFCVTLLINRRFAPVAIGAAACAVASIPPAIMCREWPWTMIAKTLEGGKHFYDGSAFITRIYQGHLVSARGFTQDEVVYLSMAIGFVLCAAMSFMLRRSDDWLEKLIPPALIAPMWTYTVPHDLALWTVPAVWLLGRKARGKVGWALALAVMAFAAVACYRGAWDWMKVWTDHYVRPVWSERFSDNAIFKSLLSWKKRYNKGLGYRYKQIVLASFFAWSAFRARGGGRMRDDC